MKLAIPQEGVNINKRFFQALELLITSGTIRGIKTFARENDVNLRGIMYVKENCETHRVRPEWVAFLAKYNISVEWVILGKGGMFKTNKLCRSEK